MTRWNTPPRSSVVECSVRDGPGGDDSGVDVGGGDGGGHAGAGALGCTRGLGRRRRERGCGALRGRAPCDDGAAGGGGGLSAAPRDGGRTCDGDDGEPAGEVESADCRRVLAAHARHRRLGARVVGRSPRSRTHRPPPLRSDPATAGSELGGRMVRMRGGWTYGATAGAESAGLPGQGCELRNRRVREYQAKGACPGAGSERLPGQGCGHRRGEVRDYETKGAGTDGERCATTRPRVRSGERRGRDG